MENHQTTYSLSIEKHDEGYLAYFPALPGCNTWGVTYEEAVQHAEEALALYIDTLVEHGDPIPEEKLNVPVSLGVMIHNSIIR